jgi:hypothetical protein
MEFWTNREKVLQEQRKVTVINELNCLKKNFIKQLLFNFILALLFFSKIHKIQLTFQSLLLRLSQVSSFGMIFKILFTSLKESLP